MDKKATCKEDRDFLLIWDAMGYNAGIRYDKHTGQLIGFAEDFQFGLCVQKFANKVNVLSVISPQEDIRIDFPVCHHHVNTLTRSCIYYFTCIVVIIYVLYLVLYQYSKSTVSIFEKYFSNTDTVLLIIQYYFYLNILIQHSFTQYTDLQPSHGLCTPFVSAVEGPHCRVDL